MIVDEQEAAVVINIFNGDLSGMSLRDSAANAGRPMVHSISHHYSVVVLQATLVSQQSSTEQMVQLLVRSTTVKAAAG